MSEDQPTIFDLGVVSPPVDYKTAISTIPSAADFYSRDIISITDIPYSSETDVRWIELPISDKNGEQILVRKQAKVLRRTAPHPTLVRYGDRVVSRDSVPAGSPIKEIMVPLLVTVVYEGGVILPIHQDVLFVILGLWSERFKFGTSGSKVKTTVHEIASRLGVGRNARTRESIRAAIKTIKGLVITKEYAAPDQDGQGNEFTAGSRTESIQGLFSAADIESVAGGSDEIVLDLNPRLLAGMTGDTSVRPFLTTEFNFTKNLTYNSPWKRQLQRMLQARLNGPKAYFRMPIIELWVSCLGNDENDVFEKDWKVIVHRLRKFFELLQKDELIKDLDFKPKYLKPAALALILRDLNPTEISLPGGPGKINLGRFAHCYDIGGWVSCAPGTAVKNISRRDFARDIAKAVLGTFIAADTLMKESGMDFVWDIGYHRVKNVLSLIGERVTRLKMEQWLSRELPLPDRSELVEDNYAKIILSGVEDAPNGVGKLCEMRNSIIEKYIEKQVEHYSIEAIFSNEESVLKGRDLLIYTEYSKCLYLASHGYVGRKEGMSTRMLDHLYRMENPEAARHFHAMVDVIRPVALRSAAQMLWYAHLKKNSGITSCEKPEYRRLMHSNLLGKYPSAFKVVAEMVMSGRTAFESAVGRLLEQRLCEFYLEEQELTKSRG